MPAPDPAESTTVPFHDPVVTADEVAGVPARFFDRFMFNLHPADALFPFVVFGVGVYPGTDVVDGFALLNDGVTQRNLRYSTTLTSTDWQAAGPFSWRTVEPLRRWELRVGPNESGIEGDLTWDARTPPWSQRLEVDTGGADTTSFDHLVQSGTWTGSLTVSGEQRAVDGWYGQRDRSRGVRTLSGGQGIHLWYQAQLADRSIGFLLVEGRDGSRRLLEGSVMHVDGTLDDIVDVGHELELEGLDVRGGRLSIVAASGQRYDVEVDAPARGTFMAGGGYGGHHGRAQGLDHLETDVYALDGSVTQQTLDSSLTDKMAWSTWQGERGLGVFEFALSRSASYHYRPHALG